MAMFLAPSSATRSQWVNHCVCKIYSRRYMSFSVEQNQYWYKYIYKPVGIIATLVNNQAKGSSVRDHYLAVVLHSATPKCIYHSLFQNCDFAAAPLLITGPRTRAIDFSTPILDVQATLLVKRDSERASKLTSAVQLLNQTEIKYGTIKSGIIIRSFLRTNNSLYKAMWKRMNLFTPSVFTDTNLDGITRVRREPYAFILPSAIGDYIEQRQPCDLRTLDRFLMNKYYAFAFPKHSILLPAFNKAISHLRRSNYIRSLYRKWWFFYGECNGAKASGATMGLYTSCLGFIYLINVLFLQMSS